ncbi:MAG: peroxidase family protein, partial [Hyphomonadaceae bacterium]
MAVKFTRTDLEFILEQIKMAENNQPPVSPHLAYGLREVAGTDNSSVPGQSTFGSADQLLPHTTNSLFQTVTVSASMLNGPLAGFAVLADANGNVTTSYAATSPGNSVIDAAPRIISNLIVDQTANNPAAVAAQQAAFDVLGTGYQQAFNPTQASPTASDGSLFINNVTPDAGLSAPFNSLFTFFGQFFDHGLDLINKGGNGTVFVPLAADDPLRTVGPDGIAGTGDEVPDNLAFMVMTRATDNAVQPGPDGILGTSDDIHFTGNTITPFVDQSQTYSSSPSHQVFLREYATLPNGKPYFTGNLLSHVNADGSHTMATWADVKANALRIGIVLNDTTDLVNLPMLKVDDYGKFIPNAQGLAQIVIGVGADGLAGTADDLLVSGSVNPDGSINAITTGPAGAAIRTGHAFLNDMAATADPVNHRGPGFLTGVSDGIINDTNNNGIIDNGEVALAPGTFDLDLLNAHYIAGDGRVNENIGLTAVHEIFHDEHNRLVASIKAMVVAQLAAGDVSFAAQWTLSGANLADGIQDSEWNGERIFQAAKFGTETQYQHLVFEEFARKVAPTIHLFGNNDITLNAAITSEFANVVYRFGHSMLDENVNRYVIHDGGAGDPLNGTAELYKSYTDSLSGKQTESAVAGDGTTANLANAANIIGTPVLNEISLIEAFTNPLEYLAHGGNAAGEIILGSANQVGNEIDEFITGALRNNLLGLPLDLASLNLARGRDVGVAGLNVIRNQLYSQAPTATQGNAAFHDTQLKPYASWAEYGQFLKHSESLINFVAAYGNHQSLLTETTLIDKRMAAYDLVTESLVSISTTPLYVDALGHLTNLHYTDAAGKHTSFLFKDAAGHYTNYGYRDAAGHATTLAYTDLITGQATDSAVSSALTPAAIALKATADGLKVIADATDAVALQAAADAAAATAALTDAVALQTAANAAAATAALTDAVALQTAANTAAATAALTDAAALQTVANAAAATAALTNTATLQAAANAAAVVAAQTDAAALQTAANAAAATAALTDTAALQTAANAAAATATLTDAVALQTAANAAATTAALTDAAALQTAANAAAATAALTDTAAL